jgi:threonine dehydrogenase-like Zn-dependent dehydrogenase
MTAVTPSNRSSSHESSGCGPVGQFAIAAARLLGGRVIAVDRLKDRLQMARRMARSVSLLMRAPGSSQAAMA